MSELCILINLKSIGKRKSALMNVPYTLPNVPATLRDLIASIVEKEVNSYNVKNLEAMLVHFLTQEQIEDKSTVGKIDFGRVYSDKKQI